MTDSLTYTVPPGGGRGIYRINDEQVPGVTDILGKFFPFPWSPATAGRDLGTDIHNAIELFENADLDEDTLDDFVRPYYDSYIEWRNETEWPLFDTEALVGHPTLRYAGRIDLLFRHENRFRVVDVKSGAQMPSHRLQTAAYRGGIYAWTPITEPIARYCLYLKKTGPAQLVEHHDHETDFRAFSQLRDVYKWLEGSKR